MALNEIEKFTAIEASGDLPAFAEEFLKNATRHLSTGRKSTDQVLHHVFSGLLHQTIKTGDRINARQLADHLGVTIVPVREALHYLAGVGLVELLPLRGAKIRSLSQTEIAGRWQVYRDLAAIGLTASAEHINDAPENADAVRTAQRNIDESLKSESHVIFVMSLLDYHRVLHEYTGMSALDSALRRLNVALWCTLLPQVVPFDTYGPTYVRNYQRITDNILWGNGPGAVAAFRHHIDWSSAIIRGARPDPEAPWIST